MKNKTEQFIDYCSNGYLEKAKKFLKEYTRQNINISEWNDEAFRLACSNGHLKVAQWLLEIEPNINISAQEEYAFRRACSNNHLEVATWLRSLHPEKYYFEVGDNQFGDKLIFQCVYEMGIRFAYICNEGNLEEAKKFLQGNPTLDLSLIHI